MSKYSPKGIPAPKNAFVKGELQTFENVIMKTFDTGYDAHHPDTKTAKQKSADWLAQEIAWFTKEVDRYDKNVAAPTKARLDTFNAYRLMQTMKITAYKQVGTVGTFTISPNDAVATAVFVLPIVNDTVYIPKLTKLDIPYTVYKDQFNVAGSNGLLKVTSTSYNVGGSGVYTFTATIASVTPDVNPSVSIGDGTVVSLKLVPSNAVTRVTVTKEKCTIYRDKLNAYNGTATKLNALKAYLQQLKTLSGLDSGSGSGSGSGTGSGSGNGGGGNNTPKPDAAKITTDKTPVMYNLPSVKWAYFNNASVDYHDKILLNKGGSPASAGMVETANQLWVGANKGSHKGMLQTYSYWKSKLPTNSGKYTDPNVPDWYNSAGYQTARYGFQFLYNPGTITMGWGGTPQVDPGLLMSGKDASPYVTPSQTTSFIQFDLIINRMADMAIIKDLGPVEVEKNLYDIYGIQPSVDHLNEIKAIKQLGTMYDVEYLLSTLIGFREFSELRGRYTADIGFLMGIPVELHLGKQLRYIGTIFDFNVTHTIFGENMVPLFTNISITFARRVEPYLGKAKINGTGSLLTTWNQQHDNPSRNGGSGRTSLMRNLE